MLERPERVLERFPLVMDPPFSLSSVRTFLFLATCTEGALNDMLRRTFGWAEPDVKVRLAAPVCLFTFTDVGRAESKDASLGWFAYEELSVFVPVLCETPAGSFLAMHVPFIYPSEGLAVAAGREVYGFPKKPARIAMPDDDDFWQNGAALSASVLGAARFDGSEWTDQTLLHVTARSQSLVATVTDAFLHAIDGHLGPLPGAIAAGVAPLLQQDLVQLKQVADTTTGGLPPRTLYRGVTRVKAPVTSIANVRLGDADKVTIELGALASEPVAQVLGLPASFSPLLAASLLMSFRFDEGEVLKEQEAAPPQPKTKVLVLGGGIGALATAHALTDTEDRRTRFDVRVLSQGHWLGGKGASHRNPDPKLGARSEEHGLHVLFGFYHNALRLLRRVYAEAARAPNARPSTFDDAFAPNWDVTFHNGVTAFDATFPKTPPGYGATQRAPSDQLDVLKGLLEGLLGGSLERFLLGGSLSMLTNPVGREVAAFGITLFKGILSDIVLGGKSFDDLDGLDFRDWMARHRIPGLPDLSSTAIMQVPYDGVFAYEGADQSRPRLAAGLAARGLLALATSYEYAPYWVLQAGMGEVVVAPLYEVLRARGVRFEQFTKVEEVTIDAGRVTRVRYARQAAVKAGPFAYEPLGRTGDVVTWLADPDPAQLATPAAILGQDPYSDAVDVHVGADPVLDVDQDFDVVVCALPAPVTARVLRGHESIDALARITRIPTVATLHTQLWFNATTPSLGWTWRATVLGGFRQPLNSMHERDRYLAVEAWPAGAGGAAPQGLLYMSGPFGGGWSSDPADPAARDKASQAAMAEALAFVQSQLGKALPQATSAGGFDFGTLYQPGAPPGGNLSGQYVRNNIDLSSRYVLCLPGGLADRPRAVVPGVSNLKLAGDWTRNGVDVPCVEATVVSALQAAEAITGESLDILA